MAVWKVFLCTLFIGVVGGIGSNWGAERGFLAGLETQEAWGGPSSDSSAIQALLPPNSVLEYVSSLNLDMIVVFKQRETAASNTGQIWWGALRRREARRQRASLVWVWKSPTYGKNYEGLFVRSLTQEGLIEVLLLTTSGAHRTYLDGVQFDGKIYKTLAGDYFTHLRYNNPQYLTEFLTADEGIWFKDLDADGNREILLANRYQGEDYLLSVYKREEGQYVLIERKQIPEEQLLNLIQPGREPNPNGHV